MQMQGIGRVNHPNANANANESFKARNKKFIFFNLYLRSELACISNAFAFAFASHVGTSLQILPWNHILIITELDTFSI